MEYVNNPRVIVHCCIWSNKDYVINCFIVCYTIRFVYYGIKDCIKIYHGIVNNIIMTIPFKDLLYLFYELFPDFGTERCELFSLLF